ncbi:uncharacterized protein LOC142342075 [Convolutriloba macropyga]|uniref:uncharacterized protein LOC142342075 n=1 Tax=Convolutriloba macropyga TaxID=536237 RepID=UPI003F5243B5
MPSVALLTTSFNLKQSLIDDIKKAGNDSKASQQLIDDLILNEKITEVVSKDDKDHPWSKSTQNGGQKSTSTRKGPVGFMVLGVRNTAAPKVSPENNFAPRMLKITVSDGYHTYHLVEVEFIKQLSVDTPPGTKIIVGGELTVRNNLVLLKPSNVQFVGGRVDEMYEKWLLTKDFGAKSNRDSGAPKFVPFGHKIDNLNIANQKKSDEKEKENDADKTENDAKFDAARDQNLEAIKQLKNEQKSYSGGATAQLPGELLRSNRNRTEGNDNHGGRGGGGSGAVGNPPRGPEAEFEGFGRGRGGARGGRRGRRGSDAEYEEGPDDVKFKAPTQQASLFDIIQNKIDDMTVQDVEFDPPDPNPAPSVNRNQGSNSRGSGHANYRTERVSFNRQGNRNENIGQQFQFDERDRNAMRSASHRGSSRGYGSGPGRGQARDSDRDRERNSYSNRGHDGRQHNSGRTRNQNDFENYDDGYQNYDNYPEPGYDMNPGPGPRSHQRNRGGGSGFNDQAYQAHINMNIDYHGHQQQMVPNYHPNFDPNMQYYANGPPNMIPGGYQFDMGYDDDGYPASNTGRGNFGGNSAFGREFRPRSRGGGGGGRGGGRYNANYY